MLPHLPSDPRTLIRALTPYSWAVLLLLLIVLVTKVAMVL